MKILFIFFCLASIGCSNTKKDLKISEVIDYKELNIFISDSLPTFLDFDEKYVDIISQWNNISLISNVKNIRFSDSREVNYIISALKTDILKISDKIVPVKLNHPQIIGRFRVLKTDILKLNLDEVFNKNNIKFKEDLKDIIISYNAFVNSINLILSKSESENLDLN
jgi:hypothetical protein